MNWVTINKDLCDKCGICVLRCSCFSKNADGINVQADIESCNLCGHCVSLCHKNAISHSQMDMSNFKEIGSEKLFNTNDFVSFIRNRRSHRHFKEKEIPQKDLDLLVDLVRYSPTGGNMQNVQVIMLRNKELISKLSNITVNVFEVLGEKSKKEIERVRAEGKEPDSMTLRIAMYGDRLSQMRKEGLDPIFYNAPAVMIFYANNGNKGDCMIASTTVSLAARTFGIESTYIGLFEIASKNNKQVYDLLKLPAENEIHSVIVMGYPKLKFLRTVDRKPVKVELL